MAQSPLRPEELELCAPGRLSGPGLPSPKIFMEQHVCTPLSQVHPSFLFLPHTKYSGNQITTGRQRVRQEFLPSNTLLLFEHSHCPHPTSRHICMLTHMYIHTSIQVCLADTLLQIEYVTTAIQLHTHIHTSMHGQLHSAVPIPKGTLAFEANKLGFSSFPSWVTLG